MQSSLMAWQPGRGRWTVAACLAGGLALGAVPAAAGAAAPHAVPAQVDGSFGQGGVASAFPSGTAPALTIQPDGDILVAGSVEEDASASGGAKPYLAVARLQPDGQPDPGFGAGTTGTAVSSVSGTAVAVAVAPDGGVLVLGETPSATSAPAPTTGSPSEALDVQTVLLRFTSAGLLDTTFGQGGQVALGSAGVVVPGGLAVDPAGDIYVATAQAGSQSSSPAGSGTSPTGVVYRLSPTGSPDPTFGSAGSAELVFAPVAAALDASGNLLVAGASVSAGGTPSGVVERLEPSGAADPTFGSDGSVTVDPPDAPASIDSVTTDPQGRIDLLVDPVNGDIDLARLTDAGALDPTFGRSGFVSLSDPLGGLALGQQLATTTDGDVVVAATDDQGLVTARFLAHGTPDVGFGHDGVAHVLWPEGGPAVGGGGALVQPNGQVVVSGTGPGVSGLTGAGYVARFLAADAGRPTPSSPVTRLSGPTRIGTAVAVSQALFATAPTGGAGLSSNGVSSSGLPYAGGVVLAATDDYPDALVGVPLAGFLGGPLLLTGSTSLEPAVLDEIDRVLGSGSSGGTVDVLGGTAVISDSVVGQLTSAGYSVHRFAGSDRYQTALDVATEALDDPTTLFEASGEDFADAASAGAAAAHEGAAILLTDGSTLPSQVAQYLAAHPDDVRYAIGAPAAAADPGATPVVGRDRYATSAAVANRFFVTPGFAAVATGSDYPDAMSGGVLAGELGGPLLLTDPSTLSAPDSGWLTKLAPWLTGAAVVGGTAAVSPTVSQQVAAAVGGTGG